MQQFRRRAVGIAAVVALAGMLSGCAYLDQIGEARDQLGTAGDRGAALDRLSAELADLPDVVDVEISSDLLAYPPTARVRVDLDAGAASAGWLAVAALVGEVGAEETLVEVSIEVQQRAADLRVDYPAEAGTDMTAEVEVATGLRDAIGPGMFVAVEGVGERYRTIGVLDRADTATTLGLVEHADAARQVMAAAPERPTQWALPGFSGGVIPPDEVLTLIAGLSTLPPAAMPGDESQMTDEPFPWIGYTELADGTPHVSIGLVDPQAASPDASALWGEYAGLAEFAPAALEGVVVFNVVWANGSGIVMGGECDSAEPTPDDGRLAEALTASGVPLDGFTTGVCLA